MRKFVKNTGDSVSRSQLMSIVSTAVLILLMLCYLIMTISISAKLAEQTEIISNHPFEVVTSAGDVKLYVSEMSLHTERLKRHHSSEDIEIAAGRLKELELFMEEPISQIEDLYLGDAEDVRLLEDALTLLQKEQSDYLKFCEQPDVAEEKTEAYAQEHLQPLYDQALGQTEDIISNAQAKKAS